MDISLLFRWIVIVTVAVAYSGVILTTYARLLPVGQGTELTYRFKSAYWRAGLLSLSATLFAVLAVSMTFDAVVLRIIYAIFGGGGLCQMVGYIFLRPFLGKEPPSKEANRSAGLLAYSVGFGLPIFLQLLDKYIA